MKATLFRLSLVVSSFFLCEGLWAQEPDQPDAVYTSRPGQDSGGQQVTRRGPDGRRAGVFGKITAIQSDSLEVTGPDGNKVTVKLTSNTEFRKDRQPAKLSDFKVGDPVFVRTDPAEGKSMTAVMVATGQGFGMRVGPGGAGGGPMMLGGTLGKDFVAGEVKAVDPPKLTVMRPDNVSQTLELNEETSLRRGRESITMADIQAGDHIVARGAVENNVFVPKELRVIPAEMWKRMQEMNGGGAAAPGAPDEPAAPPSPKSPPEPHS